MPKQLFTSSVLGMVGFPVGLNTASERNLSCADRRAGLSMLHEWRAEAKIVFTSVNFCSSGEHVVRDIMSGPFDVFGTARFVWARHNMRITVATMEFIVPS